MTNANSASIVTVPYTTSQLLNDIYDSTIKEAIQFFSKKKTKKGNNDERFFYKKNIVEIIKKAVPEELIEVSSILDNDGSVFCYKITPVYFKEDRNYRRIY